MKADEAKTRAQAWLDALDFELPARTKLAAALRILVWVVSIVILVTEVRKTIGPMIAVPKRAPLNGDTYDGHRFGMPLEKRKAIFEELAKVELAERKRAIDANTWGGHLWSREDDRGHYEMVAARGLAPKYGVSLTQIYMVLDEGIREHWLAPNGEPLPATTPPLQPRLNSW